MIYFFVSILTFLSLIQYHLVSMIHYIEKKTHFRLTRKHWIESRIYFLFKKKHWIVSMQHYFFTRFYFFVIILVKKVTKQLKIERLFEKNFTKHVKKVFRIMKTARGKIKKNGVSINWLHFYFYPVMDHEGAYIPSLSGFIATFISLTQTYFPSRFWK